MLAADFLRVLNSHLVGSGKKKGKRTDLRVEQKSTVGKTKTGIQLLSVLGLVHSTLSRPSLKLLEETLQNSVASLTDLDLSFSLLGYKGVEVIAFLYQCKLLCKFVICFPNR